MNSCQLLGRITSDPELRTTANGTNVSSFTLAVNGIKNSNGEQRTDFIPITIWNKQAENLCKYVHKGDQLVVSGKIQSSTYEDKDNNKRTRIEVLANNIQYVATKKREEASETTIEENQYEDFNGDVELSLDDDLPF